MLQKPHWSAKDIADFTGFGKTKAYEIMQIVRKEYGGTIKHLPSFVRRDSVLAFLGTSVETEIRIRDI